MTPDSWLLASFYNFFLDSVKTVSYYPAVSCQKGESFRGRLLKFSSKQQFSVVVYKFVFVFMRLLVLELLIWTCAEARVTVLSEE
jgi:hypothetical protein